MSWKPPKSPYNLIQEHLWNDPWKLFVACIFCNLTRRVDSEPYIWKFLKKYPTPQIASLACQKEVQKMIKPLGLSERHSLSLARMSNDNLSKDCKATPETLYGIGKYCSDAYHIFCLGDWKSIVLGDHALNDYRKRLEAQDQL